MRWTKQILRETEKKKKRKRKKNNNIWCGLFSVISPRQNIYIYSEICDIFNTWDEIYIISQVRSTSEICDIFNTWDEIYIYIFHLMCWKYRKFHSCYALVSEITDIFSTFNEIYLIFTSKVNILIFTTVVIPVWQIPKYMVIHRSSLMYMRSCQQF